MKKQDATGSNFLNDSDMTGKAMPNNMNNTGGGAGTQGFFAEPIQPLIDLSVNNTEGQEMTQENFKDFSSSERGN